jgi:Fe2+ transport system protein FeoA
MLVDDSLIGKTFRIKDVPESEPCQNCNSCLRLRIMELGMYSGEMIEISAHRLGLWIVNILSDNGSILSKIIMRDEEIKRIILEDEECNVKFV